MKTIEMIEGRVYLSGGKQYHKGQSYTVSNAVAKHLLETAKTVGGRPYFVEAGDAAPEPAPEPAPVPESSTTLDEPVVEEDDDEDDGEAVDI